MMPTQRMKEGERGDIKLLVQIITRNYKLFIFSAFVALGIAFLANRFMPPAYKISASLMIREEQKSTGGNQNEYLMSNLFGMNQNLQNELWVLKSAPVLEETIRNLNLTVGYYRKEGFQRTDIYGRGPFYIFLTEGHVQPVNVRFQIHFSGDEHFILTAKGRNVAFKDVDTGGESFKEKNWQFERAGRFGSLIETPELSFTVIRDTLHQAAISPDTDYQFLIQDLHSLTDEIKKKLNFNVVDKLATVIEIEFKSASVKKGKAFVDELMQVYAQRNFEQKKNLTGTSIDYIEEQLNDISNSLKTTENQLQSFRSSNQLIDYNEQASNLYAQLMDLENQLAELETKKRYYDYVAEYIQTNEDFSNMIVPSSMGINDQLLTNLMTDLISAQSERSILIKNNQEFNPMVQKLGMKIENTKTTISENITAIRMSTQISINDKKNRISELRESVRRLRAAQRQLGGIHRPYPLYAAV